MTVVVGSGIMAVRLSPGDAGLELLENALAAAAGLAVIIAVLAPVSGAHLNPVVSAADWAPGSVPGFVAAQAAGGVLGAVLILALFPAARPGTGGGRRAGFGRVISMGCGDTCPVFPGKRYLAWELPDPAGLTVEQVRPIRDDIAGRVHALLAELGVPAGG